MIRNFLAAILLCGEINSASAGLFEDKRLAALPEAARQTITSVLASGRLTDLVLTNENGHAVYEVEMRYRGLERDFSVLPDGSLVMKQTFINELTPAVFATIQHETIGAKILNIYWLNEEGDPSYYVEFQKDRQQSSFSVAPDGWVTSRQVTLTEIPAPVRAAILQKLEGRPPVEIAKAIEGDEVTFEVTDLIGGLEKLWIFNLDGTVAAQPVVWNGIPNAARATLSRQSNGSRLVYLFQIPHNGSSLYEIWFVRQGARHVCTVDLDGRIISEEVPLGELPDTIRNAISAKVAGKFVVRIEREPNEGGATYEVTLRDRGKLETLKFESEVSAKQVPPAGEPSQVK